MGTRVYVEDTESANSRGIVRAAKGGAWRKRCCKLCGVMRNMPEDFYICLYCITETREPEKSPPKKIVLRGLRREREKRRVTKADLERASGVSRATIKNIEGDYLKSSHYRVAQDLADALGVSVYDLAADDGEREGRQISSVA